MTQEIMYQAKTKDEFDKLEKRMKTFLEFFDIKNNVPVYVKMAGMDDFGIEISPIEKQIIESINSEIMPNPPGKLIHSDSESVVFDIKETRYFIRYNPNKS